MKTSVKRLLNGTFIALLLPAWLMVATGQLILGSEEAFLFLAHLFSGCPGKLGEFVRRAYYGWTLRKTGKDLVVGYGSFFTHRDVELGDGVWIGQYSIIANSRIESNVLISDRVSILSGRHQHRHDDSGRLIEDTERQVMVRIRRSSWIGAGAIVMADVGQGSVVGAGSVLTKPFPPNSTIVGVPARVAKSTTPSD